MRTIQRRMELSEKFSAPSTLLKQIGNTPLLKLQKIGRDFPNVEIYAKAEWFNPGGSVKDRPALKMIEDGEKSGALTKEKTIIDSTSGNTGIGYAMIGAAKGYHVELVMPENVSQERKTIVQAYGAKVTFSSPFEGSDGAIRLVRKIVAEHPDSYFYPDQYNNPSNWQAHYETTGVEIIEQTQGKVTHLVVGIGTSGTLMGTGRRLKEFNPKINVIAVEPESALHGLEGLKHMPSAIVPGIYDERLLDGKISANTEKAYEMAHRLAAEEGLLVGHSSGAALDAALQVAEKIREGIIVTIFPDSGVRYLSSGLWSETHRRGK